MWGENWGAMLWGGSPFPVPLMSPLGVVLLLSAFLLTGVVMQRHHAPRWARWILGTMVVLVPLAAYAGTIFDVP